MVLGSVTALRSGVQVEDNLAHRSTFPGSTCTRKFPSCALQFLLLCKSVILELTLSFNNIL